MRRAPAAAALAVLTLAHAHAQAPDLQDVLTRAAGYAAAYHREFTTIVAEEHYVQRLSSRVRTGTIAGDGDQQRTLKSDFMLVEGIAGEDRWLAFRDVFEVDGRPVSGERGRLEAWLRESRYTFAQRARALALEQARFNLGDLVRTINTPLLPLEFLLERHQRRFRFRAGGSMAVGGSLALVVSYDERERPTIIRSPDGGRSVPASGRLWIEAETGRVLMTELRTGERDRRQVRATIVVTYEHHARLKMLVPVAMDEIYVTGPTEITGAATYSNFRRFETGARMIR